MASEEQRRAFAEYMGSTATAANASGQQQAQQRQQQVSPQNPAWYAGLQNAIGQQGPQGYQRYQGLQNPYAGQQYPGFNPFAVPPAAPTPPPAAPGALATSQQLAQLNASMPPPPRPPGYVDLPRNYPTQGQQQQPGAVYNVGWQYNNPNAPPYPQANVGGSTAMAPVNARNGPPGPLVEETRDHYHSSYYTGAWPPPDVVRPQSPPRAPPPEPQVHVLLCHVCSVCGRMRSAGFHRHHPVIPGQPQVQMPCRRCKKKAKKEREKREARNNNDGGRTIRIEIARGEPRGRARSREEVVYVARRHSSPSPQRTRVGVRVLRQERSPPQVLRRTRTEVRVSSSSPPAETRFRRHRSDEVYSTRDRHHAHLPGRRVTELSPSPPPPRTRTSTRVEYRHESPEPSPREYRRQSPPPVRVSRRDRRSDDAEARLAAHPAAYRTVVPDHRAYVRDSEDSVTTDSREPSPPSRGILRDPESEYRTSQRRRMEASHDSMLPELGGARVQFTSEPRREERHVVDYTREHRRYRAPCGYAEEVPPPPPSPPLERSFERLRTRPPSPPSPRRYDDEVRVRHVSPRRYEEVRIRRNSPTPRGRSGIPQEPSPRAMSYTRYRSIERTRSVSPPIDPRQEDWEDVTESESENSGAGAGEVVSVRRYRDLDENGRPATFVEERRTRFVGPGAPPAVERTFPTTPAITRGFQPV
ncbi:hypothetical protein K458DRAFT_58647 [Lentithecium fluviatile CBS 122367]|uniref:Uncharacterized protein n=1 Tax=Lentithecium fluviatile CBS 122367 TaxID=1168545 RepID=A0A6G1IW05_9PLEO|nr:hypothetical protein K458DRAFT_58647 [Lentithecium fluviatile CBS 122367]